MLPLWREERNRCSPNEFPLSVAGRKVTRWSPVSDGNLHKKAGKQQEQRRVRIISPLRDGTKIPWKTLSPKQKQNPGKYTGLKTSVLWTQSWAVLQSGGCFKPFPAPATQ